MREERTDGLEALQVMKVFLGQCEAAELCRYEPLPGWQDSSLYWLSNVNTARRVPNAEKMIKDTLILGRKLRNAVENYWGSSLCPSTQASDIRRCDRGVQGPVASYIASQRGTAEGR